MKWDYVNDRLSGQNLVGGFLGGPHVGKCTFTKICNLFCFQKGSRKVVSVTEKENQKTTA